MTSRAPGGVENAGYELGAYPATGQFGFSADPGHWDPTGFGECALRAHWPSSEWPA